VYTSSERLLIKKFLFSKKTDGYISVFSWFSIIGITIGVAAIIIVMSVMNGFREELTSRLLGINGHINIFSTKGAINENSINLLKNLNLEDSEILPLVETQALLIQDETSQGVYLRGYDVHTIKEKNFLNENIIKGKIFSNLPEEIIIGHALAKRMNLDVGDKIRIAIPKTDKTIFGNIPRFKTLSIVGLFNLGMYHFDNNIVFTNTNVPRKLLMIDSNHYNKIEILYKDPNNIDDLQLLINKNLKSIDKNLYTISWKESNASLINALKVEKNVMFLILTLIIIVASMNIISGLIIFVKEKNKDIGILKTIGATNISLIKIFISIGIIIGVLGTTLGSLIGVIFSINISLIQKFLEKLLDTELFSQEIYYLSSLPSRIDLLEVLYVISISMLICLIATIFPAYRSSIVDPIKSLKND